MSNMKPHTLSHACAVYNSQPLLSASTSVPSAPFWAPSAGISNAEDALIRMVETVDDKGFGAIAQVLSVLRHASTLKDIKAGADAIIRSGTGLAWEAESSDVVSRFSDCQLPELAKYKTLTFRWMLKCLPAVESVMIAASLSHPDATAAILYSRLLSGQWNTAADDYGFDMNSFQGRLADAVTDRNQRQGAGRTIASACSLYPEGPFPEGYLAAVAANTANASAPTPTTASVNTITSTTTGNTTMTNATATPVASTTNMLTEKAVTSLKPEIRAIFDGMLTQFGINATIQALATDAAGKDLADAMRVAAVDAANTELTALRQRLSSVASLPSTMTIPSASKGAIPNGTMKMVAVDTLFPQLKGLNLMVPKFEWDHAHPDVPEVNADYIFRKEMLIKALGCLVRRENLWLTGHTGSGKTTFIEQIAAALGWPVARVAFDSNVDRSEMVGRMQLDGDGKGGTLSRWLPGILEIATSRGYILLCDELDAGHPNALYTLQPVLEYKGLSILEDGGRMVPPASMSRNVATGNTAGNGDPSGLYPACRILSAATLDRFTTFIKVPYMTVAEESSLIAKAVPGLAKAQITKLAKFGAELRQAFVTGEMPISYSPRRSIAFAREVCDLMAMGYSEQESMTAAFRSKLYDAASEEYCQRISEIANACLGGIDASKSLA